MKLTKQKTIKDTLLDLDNGIIIEENVSKLLSNIQEDETLNFFFYTVSNELTNKVDVLNYVAVAGFNSGVFDHIIPSLLKASEFDPSHKETLFNLSSVLAHFGEITLALDYAKKIDDNSNDTRELIAELTNKCLKVATGSEDVLNIEQNDVAFTGERLVINQEVKNNFSNVLEEHLRRYELACQYSKDKIVLDAACGAGYGSKMMQTAGAAMVVGVDIDNESLENAKKTYHAKNVNFMYGNVNQLPFKDETFDMVVSFETIEHIDSGANWIRESARLLKEDGLFLVSTPNRLITNPGTYFEEQPLNPHHHFEYSITEFIGELLNEYEILDIYGQSFVNDHESYYHKVMREARQLNRETTPDQGVRQTEKHELISLKDVKNAQPMYVVALCKKKRTTLNKPQKSQRLSQLPSNSEASKKSSLYKLGANSFLGEGSEIVGGHRISIGDNVMIKKDCWLNIAIQQDHSQPQILIEDGCQIGKNFTISVSNKAHIEKNVLIGANVYIADCGHAYENIAEPIMYQGVSSYTNEVTIGEGTWLGINSVIVGNVRVGKGSIIAANSFVNKDVPDYSVVAGSPAKVIKMFDSVTESWVIVNTEEGVQTILQNRLS